MLFDDLIFMSTLFFLYFLCFTFCDIFVRLFFYGNKISDYVIEEFLSVINVVSYECNELFKIEIFKKRVHYMLKNLSLLEGKRTIDSIYKAYKINKRLKKVI